MTDRKLIEDALAELQGVCPFSPVVMRLRDRLSQLDWSVPYDPAAVSAQVKAACDDSWGQMRRKMAA